MPTNVAHDLAMLYLQQQEFLGLTPAELADKYIEVKNAIIGRFNQIELAKTEEW